MDGDAAIIGQRRKCPGVHTAPGYAYKHTIPVDAFSLAAFHAARLLYWSCPIKAVLKAEASSHMQSEAHETAD